MPSPQAPVLSDAAIEKGALQMFADVLRVVGPALDDDAVARRWAKTPEATQEHYRARTRNILVATHDEIAGPAWAIGHDDGQTNQISEFLPDTVTRPRITNPYPYTLEGAQ